MRQGLMEWLSWVGFAILLVLLGSACPQPSNGPDGGGDKPCIANGGCDPLTTCSEDTQAPQGRRCGPCPDRYTGTGETGCEKREVIAIATGDSHACVLYVDGKLACWGNNASGQLGNGGTSPTEKAEPVAGLTEKVKAIGAGGAHTCAVMESGALACWGENGSGQLGTGDQVGRAVPTLVSGIAGPVSAVALNYGHTCAVLETGALQCWGANDVWQLGTRDKTQRSTPTTVDGVSGVVSVATGLAHTCAVSGAGLLCWGDRWILDEWGSSLRAPLVEPTPVSLGSGIARQVVAGKGHTCALLDDETVSCWGDNFEAQVTGSVLTGGALIPLPVQLSGLSAVRGLTSLVDNTCANLESGRVRCWGSDRADRREDPDKTIKGLAGVTAVGSGYNFTCAVKDGDALCWGQNGLRQLGNGTTVATSTPTPVLGL